MRMSPGVRWGKRPLTVASTAAAGTISQIARGVSSFFTRSAIDEAPMALARVNTSTAFDDLSKTTHWWLLRRRRAMFAPIRPSPIIPIRIADSFGKPIARRVRFRSLCDSAPFAGGSSSPASLEDVHELTVPTRDLGDGVFARGLLGSPCSQRLPEDRPPDGEAAEPGDGGGRRQPLAHLLVVFAPSEDDAPHVGPATAARGGHNLLAVLPPLESFDLPDVGLDLRILKLLDRLGHQPGTELPIVGLRIPLEPVELGLFRGHEQLEHEPASAVAAQVLGESLQPLRLPPVQRRIALRIVAHEHLAKGWLKGLDVLSEVLAVLEVELVLPALLGGTSEHVALRRRIAKDGSTELLIHEDARLVLGYAGGDGGPETVVDHLLGGGDLRGLLGAQRALPAEHLRLERPAVVERQEIQRLVEAHGRHRAFLSFR